MSYFLFLFMTFCFCFARSPFRHRLLWFCATTPPKPSPTSPASHHHPNQRASAAGVFPGRAPETKAVSLVVQHHQQSLFQEMRLCSLIFSFFSSSSRACSEHAQTVLKTPRTLGYLFFFWSACECQVVFSCFFLFYFVAS